VESLLVHNLMERGAVPNTSHKNVIHRPIHAWKPKWIESTGNTGVVGSVSDGYLFILIAVPATTPLTTRTPPNQQSRLGFASKLEIPMLRLVVSVGLRHLPTRSIL
jgi:hypothetical protein